VRRRNDWGRRWIGGHLILYIRSSYSSMSFSEEPSAPRDFLLSLKAFRRGCFAQSVAASKGGAKEPQGLS
jgi:hypothetical protein